MGLFRVTEIDTLGPQSGSGVLQTSTYLSERVVMFSKQD